MDALRKDDLERARRATPEEKLRETVEMMALGFELKRMSFRARYPDATEDGIERLLRVWLSSDE